MAEGREEKLRRLQQLRWLTWLWALNLIKFDFFIWLSPISFLYARYEYYNVNYFARLDEAELDRVLLTGKENDPEEIRRIQEAAKMCREAADRYNCPN